MAQRKFRWLKWAAALVAVWIFSLGVYVASRVNDDSPVTYTDVHDHFKYGSTGGERGWKLQSGFGIPYWLWIALPEQFPQYLPDKTPGQGYRSLGLIYEDGRDPRFDLPIGMSMRRVAGIDRVYFTCAICHTGTYRETAGSPRQVVLGMPANVVNFGGVGQFLKDTATDWRFLPSYLLPKVEALEVERRDHYKGNVARVPTSWNYIDRAIFNFYGISTFRDQLLRLMGQLDFVDFKSWGPGRVDTFDPPKALLGFPMDRAPKDETLGIVDFPSVWNQKARKGMQLHWDGNNCSVDERNLSAGFGTGATPATVDRDSLLRTADWLWDQAKPPSVPEAHIDHTLATRGEAIYREYCQTCHGTREPPFRTVGDRSLVGLVTPLAKIQTDPSRLDGYTPELAQAQNLLYAGHPSPETDTCRDYAARVCDANQPDDEYRALRAKCYPARFSHFRKTDGYANQPLDGLWLRAPYLHNGSVPSIWALLQRSTARPAVFYIGYDVYDFTNMGFVTTGPDAEARGWRFDTRLPGNHNGGHEGREYGTDLSDADKRALIEYLKTF